MRTKHAIIATLMLCMGMGAHAQETENNWFIQGQLGASYSLGNAGIGKLIAPAGQIAVGKYFNPTLGARLAISGWNGRGENGNNRPAYGFYYGAATVDGLLNLSTLFCGKNPERFFNTRLIAGVGYNQTFDEGASSFMGRLGLQASFRLNKAFDFNVEALANGVTDRWNRKDDHSFDSYYNVLVGITYKFGTGFNWKCPECKPVVYKNKNTKYSDAYVKSLNDKINELKRQIAEHKCPEPEPCPEVKETTPGIKSHVSFGLAKAAVTEDQQINILAIADYMKQYPESRAIVTGYADKATGTDKINDELAAKRAENVANELVNRYGISRDRLTVDSKGARIQLFPTNDWNRVVIMIAK